MLSARREVGRSRRVRGRAAGGEDVVLGRSSHRRCCLSRKRAPSSLRSFEAAFHSFLLCDDARATCHHTPPPPPRGWLTRDIASRYRRGVARREVVGDGVCTRCATTCGNARGGACGGPITRSNVQRCVQCARVRGVCVCECVILHYLITTDRERERERERENAERGFRDAAIFARQNFRNRVAVNACPIS